MVIALAGRRTDAAQSQNPHFPLENVPLVRERLRHFFSVNLVTALVCSAACGADLLALDEARSLSISRRVILPFDPQRFRETSVIDRPGGWGDIYDRILSEMAQCGDVLVLASEKDDHTAYAAVTGAILDQAATFAHHLRADVRAVLVWNGASSGDADLTQAFGDEARRRGFAVSELSTLNAVI